MSLFKKDISKKELEKAVAVENKNKAIWKIIIKIWR